MNRTIKDATVKRFHDDDHDLLRSHLADFLSAYNFGRRLKTLKGLTPFELICKFWTSEPEQFILNPLHQMPGLNNLPQQAEARQRRPGPEGQKETPVAGHGGAEHHQRGRWMMALCTRPKASSSTSVAEPP